MACRVSLIIFSVLSHVRDFLSRPTLRFIDTFPNSNAQTDGMIIFPGTGVFAGLGPLGVSMFFLSYVIVLGLSTSITTPVMPRVK